MKKTILLFLFLIVLFSMLSKNAFGYWANSSLLYKRTIRAWVSSGSTDADYELPINITYNSNMQPDFDDIRFYDSSETTELPYWIETKVDGEWAYVWVKLNEEINTTNKTVAYMYYGNPNISSNSNAQNTFILFDDFEDGILNTTKWNVTSGVSEEAGYLHLNSFNNLRYAKSKYTINVGKGIRADAKGYYVGTEDGEMLQIGFSNNHSMLLGINQSTNFFAGNWGPGDARWAAYYNYNGTNSGKSSTTDRPTANTEYYMSLWQNGSSSAASKRWMIGTNEPNWQFNNTMFFNQSPFFFFYERTWSQNIDAFYDFIIVRRYVEPNPQYSIGNEIGIGNVEITWINPINTTYLSDNFYVITNIRGSSDSYTCWYWVDSVVPNASFQPAVVANDTNFFWANETHVFGVFYRNEGMHNLTITCDDGTSNTTSTLLFTLIYTNVTSESYISTVYETEQANFGISINTLEHKISDINAVLVWNGTEYEATKNKNNGLYTFNVSFYIPLITTNNTEIEFYWKYNVSYSNGTLIEKEHDHHNQILLIAYYYLSSDISSQNVVEGETFYFYVNISKLVNSNIDINITTTFNETENYSTYLYYTLPSIFLYKTNITAPYINGTLLNETVNVSAIITYSFNGSTKSEKTNISTVTIYRIYAFNCGVGTTFFTIYFFNENNKSAINNNVNLDISMDVWKNENYKRTYSNNFTSKSSYNICIYPAFAVLKIDAIINYYAENYASRYYFLTNATISAESGLSSSQHDLNLYLLPSSDAVTITVSVKDASGNPQSNVIVIQQKYFINENSYITVGMGRTDDNGITVIKGRLYDIYYKFILQRNYTILREFAPMLLSSDELSLQLSPHPIGAWYSYINQYASNCTFNQETKILRCTISDMSGLMQRVCLNVKELSVVGYVDTCDACETTSTATLTCNLSENKVYSYMFYGDFSENDYIFHSGVIDESVGTGWFSNVDLKTEGVVAIGVLTLTMAFVGSFNPITMVLFGVVGFISGYVMNLINVTLTVIVSLVLIVAIILYKIMGR